MASEKSYSITRSNNVSEKEAVTYLLSANTLFHNPDLNERKIIMGYMGLENKFRRAFDLILFEEERPVRITEPDLHYSRFSLVELKTTRKFLPENPKGFFFGATQNEFDLAERLGEQYKFCFVSLHKDSKSYSLLVLAEMQSRIKVKRIQFQINL